MNMAQCETNVDRGGSDWVEIDSEVAEWIDSVAQGYGATSKEVTEQLLRHGCKNYEEILGWDN